jgi:LPS O-antigen subunit length determinant protein (WzzB/FepE family)
MMKNNKNDFLQFQKIYNKIVVYKNDTRENKLNPNVHLSIAAEVNERFAEEIAHKLDIEYVQQSCIAIDNENLKSKLEIAHDILSQYMDVGDIRRPMTNDGIHKWLFTFYSEP